MVTEKQKVLLVIYNVPCIISASQPNPWTEAVSVQYCKCVQYSTHADSHETALPECATQDHQQRSVTDSQRFSTG